MCSFSRGGICASRGHTAGLRHMPRHSDRGWVTWVQSSLQRCDVAELHSREAACEAMGCSQCCLLVNITVFYKETQRDQGWWTSRTWWSRGVNTLHLWIQQQDKSKCELFLLSLLKELGRLRLPANSVETSGLMKKVCKRGSLRTLRSLQMIKTA